MIKTMLLIDADNVSVDVIEQAVERLLAQHGALHVRRAYCTAEAAVKHQTVFKRLSIRPIVNLAAGKNSTDIAMAVDAVDLVNVLHPDLVAIASSDSDFAPLVARLREKGCRVVGIGQGGKTGDATHAVYDEFVEFEHGKGRARAGTHKVAGAAAAGPAASAVATPTASRAAAAAPAKATRAARSTVAAAPAAPAAPAARKRAVGAKAAPAKTGATKAAGAKAATRAAPARGAATASNSPSGAAARATPAALPDKLRQVLDCLPELERGETLELRFVSARLREAGLLARSASSTKLLAPFKAQLELIPAGAPNHVRWRGAA